MGKAIVIASGKGGTGKTTAAAAISSCLAASGKSVLCIDADAGLKNLDLCLGLADKAVLDFGDVISGRCGLDSAVIAHPDLPRLFFLTAPLEPISTAGDAEGLSRLIRFVKTVFDYCVIDSPAGLGIGFSAAASSADCALIVSASDPSSCRDSGRVVMELKDMGIEDIRLVVNRVRKGILLRTRQTIDDAVDSIGARLWGIVPEDRQVIISAAAQKPLALYKDSAALAAFDRIARRIEGEKVPVPF
ncbi:MAG: AAA family ATPase [Clostridiales bacterium]|nr:AAA family ATPase [Clostridiales bacterium]